MSAASATVAGMLPTLPSVCAEADALGVFVRWVPLPEGRRGAWHAGISRPTLDAWIAS